MKFLSLACCLLLACLNANADDPVAWDHMAQIIEAAGDIQTYQAHFEQEKFTPLLRKPIRSQGRVRIASGIARWDTAAPHRSTMLISEGQLQLYYPDQATLEIYHLGDRLDQTAVSPVPNLQTLQEHFDADTWQWQDQPRRLSVRLLPKTAQMKDAIEEVNVLLDPQTSTLRRLSITDLDGQTTALDFSDIQLNAALEASDLELKVPTGTEVVKPLEVAE